MDDIKTTQETYTKIAGSYADATLDRSYLAKSAKRFSRLLPPDSLVVDIGCGPGFDTAVLLKHNLRAVGLDFNWQMMHQGQTRHQQTVDFTQADMRRLPFADAAIDGLWVCASLLHIPHAEVPGTLAEFHRVLRPGGVLHISTKQGDGSLHAATSYGHAAARTFILWQPDQLDQVIEAAAFTILDGWIDKATPSTTPTYWIVRFAQKR